MASSSSAGAAASGALAASQQTIQFLAYDWSASHISYASTGTASDVTTAAAGTST